MLARVCGSLPVALYQHLGGLAHGQARDHADRHSAFNIWIVLSCRLNELNRVSSHRFAGKLFYTPVTDRAKALAATIRNQFDIGRQV